MNVTKPSVEIIDMKDYDEMIRKIEKIGRCIYRRYQIWIANKLFVEETREKFVYTLLIDNSIEENWKKQTEIGRNYSEYYGFVQRTSGSLCPGTDMGNHGNRCLPYFPYSRCRRPYRRWYYVYRRCCLCYDADERS